MKKPITVAEVKEGDFIRLAEDSPGGYVNTIKPNGPYLQITFDDGDHIGTVDREPDSTVWLVAR